MTSRLRWNDRIRTYLIGVGIGLMLVGVLLLMRMNQGRSVPRAPSHTAPSTSP